MGCNQIKIENGQILAQNIIQFRNMIVAERFLSGVVRDHGNHPVSTDMVEHGIQLLVGSLD